jgi:hypothetical protein
MRRQMPSFSRVDVGIEPGRRHARLLHGRDLVGHQRDQRRDHQAQARPDHAGDLVAEALSAAGGQHRHGATPGQDLGDHVSLQSAKLGVAEGAPKDLARLIEGRGFRLGDGGVHECGYGGDSPRTPCGVTAFPSLGEGKSRSGLFDALVGEAGDARFHVGSAALAPEDLMRQAGRSGRPSVWRTRRLLARWLNQELARISSARDSIRASNASSATQMSASRSRPASRPATVRQVNIISRAL